MCLRGAEPCAKVRASNGSCNGYVMAIVIACIVAVEAAVCVCVCGERERERERFRV